MSKGRKGPEEPEQFHMEPSCPFELLVHLDSSSNPDFHR